MTIITLQLTVILLKLTALWYKQRMFKRCDYYLTYKQRMIYIKEDMNNYQLKQTARSRRNNAQKV